MNHISKKNRGTKKVFLISLLFSFLFFINIIARAEKIRFTILHTSDEHSVLNPLPDIDYDSTRPDPSLGGFARLSGLKNMLEAQKPNEDIILLSSGDFTGGSPYAWLILEGYSPEIEIMRQIGYHATTIGNHEFDYGPDILTDYLMRAGYPMAHEYLPVLASNLNIPENHSLNHTELPENLIIELTNGLKLGLIGILSETAHSVAPEAEPVKVFNAIEYTERQVKKLKEKGADMIIILSHSGISDDRLIAEQVEGIDIILGGHDHLEFEEPEKINETYIIHSSYYLQKAGMLEIEYNTTDSTFKFLNDENGNPFIVPLSDTIPEDTGIKAIIDDYTQKLNSFLNDFTKGAFNDVNEPVLYTAFSLEKTENFKETTIGNFVTDAMRIEGSKVTGETVDIAFQGNGVIRGNIIPGSTEWSKNKVSFLDLVTVSGLGSGPDLRPGYPMVSFYLTAEEVKKVFETVSLLSQIMGDSYFLQVSGVQYDYDPGKTKWMTVPVMDLPIPAFKSVRQIQVYEGEGIQHQGGYKNLEDDRLYHIVSDHYLTSFLPLIGEMLPRLKLVLKDQDGNPLEVDETIIRYKGNEFKVWESVARYAASFPLNEEHQLPQMPNEYSETQNRIVERNGIPLYIYSYTGILLFLAGLGLLVRWLVLIIGKQTGSRQKEKAAK